MSEFRYLSAERRALLHLFVLTQASGVNIIMTLNTICLFVEGRMCTDASVLVFVGEQLPLLAHSISTVDFYYQCVEE